MPGIPTPPRFHAPNEAALYWYLTAKELAQEPVPGTYRAIEQQAGLRPGAISAVVTRFRPTWLKITDRRIKKAWPPSD
jgi:hypothetical protein